MKGEASILFGPRSCYILQINTFICTKNYAVLKLVEDGEFKKAYSQFSKTTILKPSEEKFIKSCKSFFAEAGKFKKWEKKEAIKLLSYYRGLGAKVKLTGNFESGSRTVTLILNQTPKGWKLFSFKP